MQESKDVLNYEKMHSIDKRRAAIDSRYRAFVTNKAFTDYFEYEHFYTITDFVHPDEVGRLKKFIDEFAGDTQEQVFRFRFKDGSYRYNLLRLLCKKTGMDGLDNIDIEMIDVQSIEAVIEHLTSDVSRLRMFLGMTQEYAFSYILSDIIICIFRYEQYQKVTIYKMDIDEWKQEMIDKSYIDPEEYSLFVTMVSDIKSYVQSFKIKMNSCLRTQSNIMERLCFCGNLFNGAGHERMMVGRIIPEDTIAQQKAIEVIDELHYDSLTKVYNKKTISDYAKKALAKAKEAQAAAAAALKKKQEEEAAEQQRQAEAAQTAANNTSSSSGNTDSGSSGGNTTITVPDTPAETTDLVLFAAILQCEAGGYNYDGILAVATVIMNRVASPLYPNTISGVVYQSGQFAPTWDGSLSRVLQRGPVSLCYQVAQEALGGARLASVSGCYQFRSASTGMSGINVGGNVFF